MSRIQEILARAERDGTARRTPTSPSLVPPPPDFTVPDFPSPTIDGTAALDPSPFIQPVPAPADAAPSQTALAVPAVAAPAALAEAPVERTATAILHRALVAAIAPHSAVAERYRALRTRLTQQEEDAPLRTIIVTSPGRGEGKSITAANLALTMAQEFQRRIVLVDADLRGPSVHSLFGIEPGPGLVDVLAGDATLDQALIHLPECGVTVLTAGSTPQFPTELLGSAAMRRVLDTLRSRYDRVLLDVTSVLPLADVSTVAPLADGVLMVVRAGATQRPSLDRALEALEDAKVLGVVLNETH